MKTYKSNISGLKLFKEPTSFEKAKIKNSQNSCDYIRKFYDSDIEIYESMFLVILNRQHNTEAYVKISQGGTAGTVVDIKIIAKYAVDCLASGVILAHNHPSGNIYPSDADKVLTQKTKEALSLFDINLIDHIIITKESYYSFADNGIL